MTLDEWYAIELAFFNYEGRGDHEADEKLHQENCRKWVQFKKSLQYHLDNPDRSCDRV